jgi:hypothetical protein
MSILLPQQGYAEPQQARLAYPMPPMQSSAAPMPLHVAVSMNNLRRASLPGNSRAYSAGLSASIASVVAGGNNNSHEQRQDVGCGGLDQKSGSQRLSPIEDKEQTPEPPLNETQLGYFTSPSRGSGHAKLRGQMEYQPPSSGGVEYSMPTGLEGDSIYRVSPAGPLFPQGSDTEMRLYHAQMPAQGLIPNPEFSFGSPHPVAGQEVGANQAGIYAQPQGPIQDAPPYSQAFPFRGRIGSMASILSQATTDGGATTDGTSSDTERLAYAAYQQAIAPVDTALVTPLDGPPMGLTPPKLVALPHGFQSDARRASA